MEYSYKDIFNTVKSIIVKTCPFVDTKKIEDSTLLKRHLSLDNYDIVDIICEVEKHYNKFFDIERLEKAHDVGTFCHIVYKELNRDRKNIKQLNLLNQIKQFFTKQK